MKEQYTTSQIAKSAGVHPNTVRLYEELELITKPERRANGYRVFTWLHIEQMEIIRLAFEVVVLQKGLRKMAANIVKTATRGELEEALDLMEDYLSKLTEEEKNAEEAIQIVEGILAGKEADSGKMNLSRKETAKYLGVTIDTLRNWELNGLFTIKRRENGYRVYRDSDIRQLIIIKSLRCANYSLASILRMLKALERDPGIDLREAITYSERDEDILTACDQLLDSLAQARINAEKMRAKLLFIKSKNSDPPL